MASETIHLDGHIIDSLTLSKVLDLILLHGGTYEVVRFQMGSTRADPSHAEMIVRADTPEQLDLILHQIGQHGATRPAEEADLVPAKVDGVFPDGFYATTNLESFARVHGRWIPVENI